MIFSSLFALLPLLATSAYSAPVQPQSRDYKGSLLKSSRDGSCLSLPEGQQPGDGVPVVTRDCSVATRWDTLPGVTKNIQVYGTNYALDIGLDPHNNGPMKVWTNYDGAPQQTWYANGAGQLQNEDSGQCIDVGDNGVQTYECFYGNTNQKFLIIYNDDDDSSGNGGGNSGGTPSDGFVYIKSDATPNSASCLTVQNGFLGQGSAVDLSSCMTGSDGTSIASLAGWILPPAGSSGPIKISSAAAYEKGVNEVNNDNFKCLDAGNDPSNASGLKVWDCYDGLLQQTWNVNYDDGTIRLANNQCLDVEKESLGYISGTKPYPPTAHTQTWECSTNGDIYQKFFFTTEH